MMDLQRIHVKILADAAPTLSLQPFLAIFGRWRHEKNNPAEWVDLADYAHVPRAASVLLAGLRANFAFDMAGNGSGPKPGVLYVARKGLTGTDSQRIASAIKSCLELSERLIAEKEFPKGVHLLTDAIELRFPDRLETPNTPAVDQKVRPALVNVLDSLFGANTYELTSQAEPEEALAYRVKSKKAEPLAVLSQRLK